MNQPSLSSNKTENIKKIVKHCTTFSNTHSYKIKTNRNNSLQPKEVGPISIEFDKWASFCHLMDEFFLQLKILNWMHKTEIYIYINDFNQIFLNCGFQKY